MVYDAFISYSHAADGRLAPALQRALHRFAKPWYRKRALHVFRDETSLAAAHDLSAAIYRALDTARFFLLLASPAAAASKWVQREIAHWVGTRPAENILIVLTGGTIAWSDAAGDFDWARTDALPPGLASAFKSEPLWVDLSWASASEHLSARAPRFQAAVAMLASRIHGRPLDELSGEDVRAHRQTRRIAAGAFAAIVLLALGSAAGAWYGIAGQRRAEHNLGLALGATDELVLELAEGTKDLTGAAARKVRAILERAERILERLDPGTANDQVQRRRAVMLRVFAESYMALGDTAEARTRALRALAILEPLARSAPDDVALQRELAAARHWLGIVEQALDRLDAAFAAYRAAHDGLEALVRRAPDDLATLVLLAVSKEKLGHVHFARRQHDEALEAYRAALALRRRLLGAAPDQAEWRRDFAVNHNWIGNVQLARGDIAAALASYREGLRVIEALVGAHREQTRWLRDLAFSHAKIGDAHAAATDWTAALAAHRHALSIRLRLAAIDPDNTRWRRDLADSHERIGDMLRRLNESAAAFESYRAALAAREALAGLDPRNADWARDLEKTRQRLAEAEAEARATAQ